MTRIGVAADEMDQWVVVVQGWIRTMATGILHCLIPKYSKGSVGWQLVFVQHYKPATFQLCGTPCLQPVPALCTATPSGY